MATSTRHSSKAPSRSAQFRRIRGPPPLPSIDPPAASTICVSIPQPAKREMRYHIEFVAPRRTALHLRRHQVHAEGCGEARRSRILQDYTTLYCHVYRAAAGRQLGETGTALLKFRTFEDLAAVGSLAGIPDFVPGDRDERSGDSVAGAHALSRVHRAIRAARIRSAGLRRSASRHRRPGRVARGAETPDFFSTRSTAELQAIL